jgi:hypothetical protein
MKTLPLVITAGSVAALMGAAQANAALVFDSTTNIDGPALTITGGGVGTGTGSFGATSLTINSVITTATNLTTPATITSTSTYNGTIAAGLFSADGTGTAVSACTGDATVCGGITSGPIVGGDLFTVATAGGTWTTVGTQYNGLITITTTSSLSAIPLPAAAWLFGSALLGLAGVSRKRKVS